jgi:excisionase family DNA binding protein
MPNGTQPKPQTPRNWYNIKEAAAFLGASVKVVRRLVRQKKLKGIRDGRTSPLRFRHIELMRYLDRASTVPPEPLRADFDPPPAASNPTPTSPPC